MYVECQIVVLIPRVQEEKEFVCGGEGMLACLRKVCASVCADAICCVAGFSR